MKVCLPGHNFQTMARSKSKKKSGKFFITFTTLVRCETSDCEKVEKDLMQIITRSRRRSCPVTVKSVEKRAKIEKSEKMDFEENQIGVMESEAVEWATMPSLPLVQIMKHLKYSER